MGFIREGSCVASGKCVSPRNQQKGSAQSCIKIILMCIRRLDYWCQASIENHCNTFLTVIAG